MLMFYWIIHFLRSLCPFPLRWLYWFIQRTQHMTPVVSSTSSRWGGNTELTAENVFVVFFYVVNDGASYLNFCEQVKISKNEEYFSSFLEIVAGVILKHKQIIFLNNILSETCLGLRILNVEVWSKLSVSIRENVEANLENQQGKVYVSNFVVEPFEFGVGCLWLCRLRKLLLAFEFYCGLTLALLFFNH